MKYGRGICVHFSIALLLFIRPTYTPESFFCKHESQEAGRPLSTWATCHVWLIASYITIRPVFRATDNRFIGDELILTNFQANESDEDENSTNAGQTTVKLIEKAVAYLLQKRPWLGSVWTHLQKKENIVNTTNGSHKNCVFSKHLF